MDQNPLDLEQHEKEQAWGVWKRRLMFGLIIVLCITFAAPTFGSCSGVLGGDENQPEGTWQIDGEMRSISRARFSDTQRRLVYTYNLLEPQIGVRAPDGKEFVWSHILVNDAAEAQGVHVPDARVAELIRANPYFQVGGEYDERGYRRVLQQRTRGELSHRDFVRTVREILRSQEYRRLYQTALQVVPSREAFERWRERNEKLTVEYVVQPFGPLREEVEADAPEDSELETWLKGSRALMEKLQLPARRTVEVLYSRARDMSDEQAAAAKKLLEDQGVIDTDPEALDRLAIQLFYSEKDSAFSRSNWLAQQAPRYEAALELHAQRMTAWEEAGSVAADKPVPPPNPEDEEWPTKVLDQYDRFWKDAVRKEALGREVVRLALRRAAAEGVAFDVLAPDYAAYGLDYAKNETPLTADDMPAEYPADLAVDSEFVDIVRGSFKGPAGEAPFLPEVYEEPVPTTWLASALDRRGYMALRFAGFDPPRPPEFSEVREEVLAAHQRDRIMRLAKERLTAVRDAVSGGKSLSDAAAAAGLEVAEFERFNRLTSERRVPPVPAEEPADSEFRRQAEAIRSRNRVLRDYARLSTTDEGAFRDPILIDEGSQAALLMRVVEKHQPTEMEVPSRELETQRLTMLRESLQEQVSLLQYEELARRFHLELNPLPNAGADEDGLPPGSGDPQ